MRIYNNYNLKEHNTFGINALCHQFIEFTNEQELKDALAIVRLSNRPLLILGEGSNLLLTKNFDGIILHSAIKGCTTATNTDDGLLVRAGSGENWDEFVETCINNGWHGLENLSYIPGTVGASAVQNIGAYGCEAKDLIYSIEAVEISTGENRTIYNAECRYSYRKSIFKNDWHNRFVITHVTYKLSASFTPHIDYGNIKEELARRAYCDSPTAKQLREVIIDIRKTKLPDPKEMGNAGSFFMNPIIDKEQFAKLLEDYPEMPHYPAEEGKVKVPAGWLIEKCGWKGRTLGNAGVHKHQALVLVNVGEATGEEVVLLCNTIRTDVESKFGIAIHPEVNII